MSCAPKAKLDFYTAEQQDLIETLPPPPYGFLRQQRLYQCMCSEVRLVPENQADFELLDGLCPMCVAQAQRRAKQREYSKQWKAQRKAAQTACAISNTRCKNYASFLHTMDALPGAKPIEYVTPEMRAATAQMIATLSKRSRRAAA